MELFCAIKRIEENIKSKTRIYFLLNITEFPIVFQCPNRRNS